MTISEANKLVKKLIGEDDFHDVEDVLSSYYDLAQREIATSVCPIVKTCDIDAGSVESLPQDMFRLVKVAAQYTRPDINHIRIEGKGKVKIVYFAYPVKIYDNSPLSTEFEVAPQAQSAIPYFAAAQAVLSDSDMRRYYAFMDMFNNILTNVCASNEGLSTIRVVRQEEL